MKILHLCTSDGRGGADVAALRLHRSLLEEGVESRVKVQVRHTDEHAVQGPRSRVGKLLSTYRPNIDQLRLACYRNRRPHSYFSPAWLPFGKHQIAGFNPDIIHMHWICGGFLNVRSIASFNKPVVWTMHDMWPFTGGCHYAGDCKKYENRCGACPQLSSSRENDLSRSVNDKKFRSWDGMDLTPIAPSRWLKKCGTSSRVFRNKSIVVIPNCIDTQVFKPVEQSVARSILNLPVDKKILLFGAVSATSDKRKGFELLEKAIIEFEKRAEADEYLLLVFGSLAPSLPPGFGIETRYLGRLNDDTSLVLAYSSADAFILPSLEDNLPNTILEAMACGLPCVGNDVGGVGDMIQHKKTGYLSKHNDSDDLSSGIAWVLHSEERRSSLSRESIARVRETYSFSTIAKSHINLYREILHRSRESAGSNETVPPDK